MSARPTPPPVDPRHAAFDALPSPTVVLDVEAAVAALDKLRSTGVVDLLSHLHVNPAVRTALTAQICGIEANAAALTAAGVASVEAWRAGLPRTQREPGPAILGFVLSAAWDRRGRGERVVSLADPAGRRHEYLLQYAVTSSDDATDWSRVIVTVTDLNSAGSLIAAHIEERDLHADIFARANVLVWRARVRRVEGNFIWKFQVPANSLASRLFHFIQSPDKGDLWDPARAPDLASMEQRSRTAMITGAPGYQQEFPVVVDGTRTWLSEDVTIQQVNDSEWSLVGVVSDVTARHAAEDAHRKSAAQLRNLLERADCMLWHAHVRLEAGAYRWKFDLPASGLQSRLFGDKSRTGRSGLTITNVPSIYGGYPVLEQEEMNARSEAAFRHGRTGYDQEFRVQTPDLIYWLHEQVSITSIGDGQWEVVGVVTDITSRHDADAEQRATELRLQQLLTRVDCMIWEARVQQTGDQSFSWSIYTPASNLYRQLFGTDPAPTDPRMWASADVPEIAEMHRRSGEAMRSGAPGYTQEFRVVVAPRTYWMREQVTIKSTGPGTWELVGVVTDITARRAAEAALAAEKERLAVTLRAMSEGVVTTDTRGQVLFLNRAAAGLIGREPEDAVGRPLAELCVFSDARTTGTYVLPLEQVLRDGAMIDLPPNTVLTQPAGRSCVVAGRCAPVRDIASAITGAVLVLGDVTERQRLDEHLQRASKLESVGILAGGIAHDFNNILTAIMGNLSLTLLDAPEDSPTQENLRDAQTATLRARDLTQQLLTFAKGGDPVRTAVHLPEVITEVTRFAMHGSAVGCEFELPADLWTAHADKGQVGQIVQNLVINAVQAMSGSGGLLRIGARNDHVSISAPLPLTPGDYVHVTVADTGTGIGAENLTRIFDPYFSTKQHGHGLGLATVYSIVRRHDGHIEVESEIGRGSTFHIWLPAMRQTAGAAKPGSTAPPDLALHGRVLFMDDEAPIRKLGETLLRRLGLDVQVASDGDEAVRLFETARSAGRPFDVVVMDLTVPGGMGGREALDGMRQIDPAVRAIVSSGYSSDPVMANHQAFGFCAMVAKPYEVEAFARALRSALSREPHPGT